MASAYHSYGIAPPPALNELRIEVDAGHGDWCTAVDWAALSIEAMAPLLFVHGVAAGPDSWDDLDVYLQVNRIPHERFVQLGRNNTIENNGTILDGVVDAVATSFGVQNLHLLVHSKGGLDSRSYLAPQRGLYHPAEVRILSFHTFGTPHHGSVLADIGYQRRVEHKMSAFQADDEIYRYYGCDGLVQTVRKGPLMPALQYLTTGFIRDKFAPTVSLPAEVKFYTYSADADHNNDGIVSSEETSGLIPAWLPGGCEQLAYDLMRYVSEVEVRTRWYELYVTTPTGYRTTGWYSEPVLVGVRPDGYVQDNDLVVAENSAIHGGEIFHMGPVNANHGTIKSIDMLAIVLDRIRLDFPFNSRGQE